MGSQTSYHDKNKFLFYLSLYSMLRLHHLFTKMMSGSKPLNDDTSDYYVLRTLIILKNKLTKEEEKISTLYQYRCGYLWSQGRREKNQDSLALWQMSKGKKVRLFGIICDGIGGLSEGENASGYVTRQSAAWFRARGYKIKGSRRLRAELCQLMYQLHEELKEYGEGKGIKLGTTMTFFLAENKHFFWGHMGDSRLYLLRRGRVRQITTDHQEKNGILTHAIGVGEWRSLDTGWRKMKNGDKLLLCTDGFYRGLTKEELCSCLGCRIKAESQIERILKQIGERKLAMGEEDNLSALFCEKESYSY